MWRPRRGGRKILKLNLFFFFQLSYFYFFIFSQLRRCFNLKPQSVKPWKKKQINKDVHGHNKTSNGSITSHTHTHCKLKTKTKKLKKTKMFNSTLNKKNLCCSTHGILARTLFRCSSSTSTTTTPSTSSSISANTFP